MTTWTNVQKYATQTPISYNESAKTYNQANYNYNGKLSTIWSNQTKN